MAKRKHSPKQPVIIHPVPGITPPQALPNAQQGLMEIQTILQKRKLRLVGYPEFTQTAHGSFELVINRFNVIELEPNA